MKTQLIPWTRDVPPTQEIIQQILDAEGLTYYAWSNAPGDIYAAHVHPFDKVLYVVRGSISFELPDSGRSVKMSAGDRLELPANTWHGAIVGPEGVLCLEAHKEDHSQVK